jgi:hypothetical protein
LRREDHGRLGGGRVRYQRGADARSKRLGRSWSLSDPQQTIEGPIALFGSHDLARCRRRRVAATTPDAKSANLIEDTPSQKRGFEFQEPLSASLIMGGAKEALGTLKLARLAHAEGANHIGDSAGKSLRRRILRVEPDRRFFSVTT